MDWYLAVLQKYATFEGRARRKEYWMYFLVTIGISIVLAIVDGVTGLGNLTGGIGLGGLYSIGVLLPGLAVAVRRLHDTNHSGFWLLIVFVPFAGIYLLYLFIKEGDSRSNNFGPNPKAGERKSYDDDDLDARPRNKRSRNDEDDDERDERPRNKRRNDDD